MVVPPEHPKMIIFLQENQWLLGTTILGNPHIKLVWIKAPWRKKLPNETQKTLLWYLEPTQEMRVMIRPWKWMWKGVTYGGCYPTSANNYLPRASVIPPYPFHSRKQPAPRFVVFHQTTVCKPAEKKSSNQNWWIHLVVKDLLTL